MKQLFTLLLALFIIPRLHAQVALQHYITNLTQGFILNAGQVKDQFGHPNKKVSYIFGGGNFSLALNSNGFSYELHSFQPEKQSLLESDLENSDDDDQANDEINVISSRIDVMLLGANQHPEIIPEQPLNAAFNFYSGGSAKDAEVGIPGYQKITYKNIYKGIDLEFTYRENFRFSPLEYRFIVHPGADLSQIRMRYEGASFMKINSDGDLSMGNTAGEISERGLYSFEEKSGSPIACHYKMVGKETIGFDLHSSPGNTIIIDPEIVWGTYYGGKGSENFDTESEVKVDHDGNIILTGSTTSTTTIATTGAYQTTYGGVRDMFLAKFNTDGKSLVFATYYGGADKDVAYAVDVDPDNNIFLGGLTQSDNLATPGSYKPLKSGSSDALFAKFSSGGQLLWATYIGGTPEGESEHVRSINCTADHQIYLCGFLTSPGCATAGAFQTTFAGGGGDAFIARFDENGFPKWITYYGGVGKDRAHTVLSRDGYVYVTGTAKSKKGMSTLGAFQTQGHGGDDGFLAKFDTAGHMVWATYFGGEGMEHGRGLVLDGNGNIYIDGWTNSATGIATPGSYMPVKNPVIVSGSLNDDGYIAKFDPSGNLLWSTYFGGDGAENIFNLSNDQAGNIYFCGKTGSTTNISTAGSFQSAKSLGEDGFIGKMNTDGNLMWCTYFGGNGQDEIYDMDFDAQENFYFNFSTTSSNLPTTAGAYRETLKGGIDIALFKMMLQNGCIDNFESNNTNATAATIVASDNPSCYGFNAKINGPSDEDWYKVKLVSAEPNLKITLLDFQVPLNIQVYNASGNLLNQTTGSDLTNRILIYNASSGASYYIHIAHDNTVTDTTGCYRMQTLISGTPFVKMSDVENPDQAMKLEFFPNPAFSEMNIRFSADTDGMLEEYVTDEMGRRVMHTSVEVKAGLNEWKLDVTNLPAGIYTLSCMLQSKLVTQTFVIAR